MVKIHCLFSIYYIKHTDKETRQVYKASYFECRRVSSFHHSVFLGRYISNSKWRVLWLKPVIAL